MLLTSLTPVHQELAPVVAVAVAVAVAVVVAVVVVVAAAGGVAPNMFHLLGVANEASLPRGPSLF